MLGLRKSALCLHGMHKVDRDWLLERLPKSYYEELNVLLAELKALGIPGDGGLQGLDMQTDAANIESNDTSGNEHELDCTDAKIVWAVLSEEPPSVVAFVLACRRWSWSAVIIKQYEKYQHCRLVLPQTVNTRVRYALLFALLLRVRKAKHMAGIGSLLESKSNSQGFFRRLSNLWTR